MIITTCAIGLEPLGARCVLCAAGGMPETDDMPPPHPASAKMTLSREKTPARTRMNTPLLAVPRLFDGSAPRRLPYDPRVTDCPSGSSGARRNVSLGFPPDGNDQKSNRFLQRMFPPTTVLGEPPGTGTTNGCNTSA